MKRLFCGVLVLWLAGCVSPGRGELSCEEIGRLQGLIGKEMSAESLQAWVCAMYDLPSSQVTVEPLPDDFVHLVRWKKHDASYLAELERLVATRVDTDSTWAANQVITCLGQPAQYSARYSWGGERNELHFPLLYPDQGMLVDGYKVVRPPSVKQPPAIDGRLPIVYITLVRPGTAEQILYQIYDGGRPGMYEEVLREYRPWPGSWQGIVVDIDPNLQP
jgi:hypothetical protein